MEVQNQKMIEMQLKVSYYDVVLNCKAIEKLLLKLDIY